MVIDIEKYLQEKGENYRVIASRNPQFALSRCICCGDNRKDKFYISCDTGMWDCKLCSSKGDFNSYRKFFLDSHIVLEGQKFKLPDNYEFKEFRVVEKSEIRDNIARLWGARPLAIDYLISRGLNEKTIKYFQLGVNVNERLSIPIYNDGIIVDIVSGKLPTDTTDTPKYLHESGSTLSLLNRVILEQKEKPQEIFITEGSFDAMTIFQEISENVVGSVGGAGYLGKDWIELFKGVKKIFICFDTDKEGKRGAKELAKFLGVDRCTILNLPEDVNDVNDYFFKSSYSKEAFLSMVDRYRPKKDESVKHISEFSEEVLKNIESGDFKGLSTGIKELDDILGGWKSGHLNFIAALTSIGKSTYGGNLVLACSYTGIGTYFTSLEMTPVSMVKKLIQMCKGIGLSELEKVNELVLEKVKDGVNKLSGYPIYLYNNCGLGNYSAVEQGIRIAVGDYGVKVIFIDYLQYFVLEGRNIVTETGILVNKIKTLAMELQITINVMSQLNRSGRSKKKTGMYIPTLTDLKESSTLEQSADAVIFICRDNESPIHSIQRKTVVKVAKNREGKTGYFSANFDGDTGIFSIETGRDYLVEMENDAGIIDPMEGDDIFN